MAKTLPIVVLSTLALGVAAFGVLTWAVHELPQPPLTTPEKYSRAIYDREGVLLRLSLAEDGAYRLPVKLNELSPDLVKSTLEYEDRYYYKHPGVNPLSLIRASVQSLLGRSIGASTITMQVARMELGLNTKSIKGKLEQILWALRYEQFYSKEQILEAYFALAPYGGNVEGAQAASQIYFGKSADKLTPSEAISLAVVPQNPVKRNPQGGEDFDQARVALGDTLLSREVYPERLRSALLAPRTGLSYTNLPFEAPHYVRMLEQMAPQASRIDGTLSLRLTQRLNEVMKAKMGELAPYGVKNAALFLVDTRTNQVLAQIGSADFFDDTIEGEVDGTRAIRSVGSTLKPFIYALALDQGRIHSQTILLDEPRNWSGYEPKNEDNTFKGPLSAQTALIESRNIPALTLESELNPDLYDLLKTAGVDLPHDKAYYGLPIALGTAGLSMQKLTELYASLAHGGIDQALVYTLDATRGTGTPLVSPEAAWIVRAMLQSAGLTVNSGSVSVPLAVKTGTSNGYRDAWAAGLIGPYAMTVWLGNFNNRPNAKLKGAAVALPLFTEAARTLVNTPGFTLDSADIDVPKPQKVQSIAVCARTGDPVEDSDGKTRCTETTSAWFIPGKSPIAQSPWLKLVAVNDKGERTCGNDAQTWVYAESWPAHLVDLAKAQGTSLGQLPAWSSPCANESQSRAPQILMPAKDALIYAGTASEKEASVVLKGTAQGDVQKLYWYDGARYLGVSRPNEPLGVALGAGRHQLSVMDDAGSVSRTSITVKLP